KISDGNNGDNYSYTYTPAATGEITPYAIEFTAVTDSRVYNGGLSSSGVPTITSGSLQGSDTRGSVIQAFANKNVGTSKTLTPEGVITDGNSGNNYSYTYVNNTTGEITAKDMTVTGITANNKVYDGTTTATINTGSAAIVGKVSGDSVTLNTASASGAFIDPNVGTGKTVIISGLVIEGADAGNYSLIQPTTTADITGSSPKPPVPPAPPSPAENVLYRDPFAAEAEMPLEQSELSYSGEVEVVTPADVIESPASVMPTEPPVATPTAALKTEIGKPSIAGVFTPRPIVSPQTIKSMSASAQLPQAATFGGAVLDVRMPKITSPNTFKSIALSTQMPAPAIFTGAVIELNTPKVIPPDAFRGVTASATIPAQPSPGKAVILSVFPEPVNDLIGSGKESILPISLFYFERERFQDMLSRNEIDLI
ncbi:MAG: YDG domain-containing protein, partial [Candidatus Omnitrophica bacterium]|nr:YDG domain-containing protein [Candidatus Omnitrophota bacterium]